MRLAFGNRPCEPIRAQVGVPITGHVSPACRWAPITKSRKPGVQVGVFLRISTLTFEFHPFWTGF